MAKVIEDLDPKVLLLSFPNLVALIVDATLDTWVKDMLGMKPSRTTSSLSRNARIRKDQQRALTRVHDLDTL